MTRRVLLIIGVVVVALATAATALANVHVPRGTTVSEIRVLGQDVRIDGRARGPVIVVGGSLTVGPTGQAANVTVIGGGIRTAPGGRLVGDVFQFGGEIPDLSGWRLGAAAAGALIVRALLVCLLLGVARALAASRHLDDYADGIATAPARTLAAGALASLGAVALALLLALTVVGIPVTLMLVGVLILGVVGGLAVALRALPASGSRRMLLVWLAIPGLGDALLALALAFGMGGLLRWLGRGRGGEARFSLPRA